MKECASENDQGQQASWQTSHENKTKPIELGSRHLELVESSRHSFDNARDETTRKPG